jgi:hypothetical protein
VTPCPIRFTDVDETHAFYLWIRCLACRGIVAGYADGSFRPFTSLTRGQAAKFVANAAALTPPIASSQQTFADVPNSNPFWLWIERLAGVGALSGYTCGGPGEPCDPQNRPYFRWGTGVTRSQLAKIVAITAGFTDDPATQTFADVPPSHPFYRWVEQVAARGIISGYPCGGPGEPCDGQQRPYFRPFNSATRGQTAKIVANTFFPGCVTP